MPAFVETMMYAGDVPWHTLGKRMPEDVASEEAIKAAGLDWNVRKVEVYDAQGNLIPGVYGMARSDTGRCFEGVSVGERYEPFQNAELFAFGDALRAEGGVRWHTAGSVKYGRRVWTLAQAPGQFEIKRRNGESQVTAPFLLLTTSHDGTSSVVVKFTSVRVVCWNTLSAALKGSEASFKARHTASVTGRAKDAANALGLAAAHFEAEREVIQGLADSPMSAREFAVFASQVITEKDDPEEAVETLRKAKGRSESILKRKGRELVQLFHEGDGNRGEDASDALNAVTQWVDRGPMGASHGAGSQGVAGSADLVSELADAHFAREGGAVLDDAMRKTERRLESAWFGKGEETKERALDLLIQTTQARASQTAVREIAIQ